MRDGDPAPPSAGRQASGSPGALAQNEWVRTLWLMVGIQFIMTLSFTVLSPILPLFLPQIGVHAPAAIDLWTGILNGITSLVAAFVSPVWVWLAVLRSVDRLDR